MADLSQKSQPQNGAQNSRHRLSLADWRESYGLSELNEEQCESNPIVLFERWIEEARAAGLRDANAMTLATATREGRPSARLMLLKEVSDNGFIFYTNYTSRKARELDSNPYAALTFFWPELERQVRVEGEVHRLAREQNEAYFRTRARGSQLGAWASHQSQPIASRAVLHARLEELKQRFAHLQEIPTPEFWGGYCLTPSSIEFWQGRPDRLHDRLCCRRKGEGKWIIERLSP
jgi:pyridoxamine 5'-phosphate oxidase